MIRMIIAGAAVLSALVFGGPVSPGPADPHVVLRQDGDPPQSGLDVERMLKTCRKCHVDVVTEWEASRHAQAWTSPVFQAAIVALPDQGESCARCHAPDSVVLTGPGKLPAARPEHRELGVNCTTCHMDGKKYFGPYESKGHGGVVALEEYASALICSSCHGQPDVNHAHDQYSSYLESPAAKAGRSCQECHMESVEREMVESDRGRPLRNTQPARACRKHRFEGAQTTGRAEGAATLRATWTDAGVRVAIEPETGHSLPASEGREVRLRIVFQGADGAELGSESELWDYAAKKVLRPGAETVVERAAPPGTQSASVRLALVFVAVAGRPQEQVLTVATAELSR